MNLEWLYKTKISLLQVYLEYQVRTSEYVFPLTEDELRGIVERARSALGFYFSIKTLRATFGTMCYELGIRDSIISKWLGHTTIHTTYNYYIKVLDDFERQEILKFNPEKD